MLNGLFNLSPQGYYLLDLDVVTDNFNRFYNSISAKHKNLQLAYSYKTNYTPVLCKHLHKLGAWAEVVSEMEFDLAVLNKVKPPEIILNGPSKTRRLVDKCLNFGSLIQIDNLSEWLFVKEWALLNPTKKAMIGLRVNPTDDYKLSSRFGLSVADSEFEMVLQDLEKFPQLSLKGLHIHVIDQARTPAFFANHIKYLQKLSKKYSLELAYLNIGGGFYSEMHPELEKQFLDNIPSMEDYGKALGIQMQKINPEMKLIIEPGALLVANAMSFACKIAAIKKNGPTNLAICTGSKYNIKPTLHAKQMPFTRIGEEVESQFNNIQISGYTCKEDDILIDSYSGPLAVGDVLLFDNLGAYVTVFKPPFIEPDFAIYSAHQGNLTSVRRQQTLSDILMGFDC